MHPLQNDKWVKGRAPVDHPLVQGCRRGYNDDVMRPAGVAIVMVVVAFAPRLYAGEGDEGPGALEILRRVTGAITGVGEDLLKAGNFEGPARARAVRFRFLTATDLTGWVSRKSGRWEVTDIKGRLGGGELTGSVCFYRDEEDVSVTEVDLVFQDVDALEVTREAEVKEYRGKLRGRLNLTIRGGTLKGLHGEGSVYLTEGRFAGVPLIAQVLAIMGAPRLRRTNMTDAEGHFTLTPRGIVFQGLEFSSEDGSIRLKAERNSVVQYDGTIRMALLPAVDARILAGMKVAGEFASEILRAIERRVARIVVKGTLSEPEIIWNPRR